MDVSTPDNESLGTLLRRLRLERSLDISDVAEETRIPPATIRAMEADDFDSLPALAFARGFYGIYSDLLNLDQDEIMARFLADYNNADTTKKSDGVSPSMKGKQSRVARRIATNPVPITRPISFMPREELMTRA